MKRLDFRNIKSIRDIIRINCFKWHFTVAGIMQGDQRSDFLLILR